MKIEFFDHTFTLKSIGLAMGLASVSLQAQTPTDQIVPFAADVKNFQTVLQPSGIAATLKFSNSGNNVFYFPVLAIQAAEVRNSGGQFVAFSDAQGHLQIPTGPSTILSVTLRDFLQDIELQNEILQNLATNSFVRQFAPNPVLTPAAVQSGRIARLIFSDPAANNARHILGESPLTEADAKAAIEASFFLNSDTLALLRSAPDARYLSVVVDQTYRAQFRSTDLQVTLQSAEDSLANVLRSLRSIPEGRPTYLLSPSLPLQTPAGFVGKDSSFSSTVRSATKLDVLVRQGSNVDPNLLDRMLSFAFNQANLAIAVSAQERQNAVATILVDDGLSITLPLGHLNNVALDIRNDSTSQYSSAFIAAATKSQETTVHGSADVDIAIFGGSVSTDVAQKWSRSDYVNSKLDQINHQLEAMSANVTGDILYVTGISFNDAGSVQNVNLTDLQQNFTQFSVDYATLQSTRSLTEYAQQLNQARQVETLLVPQVLVGYSQNLTDDGWQQEVPGSWWRYKESLVTFAKPFANPPDVITALVAVDWVNTSASDENLLTVHAVNVTTTNAVLYFKAPVKTTIWGMQASWVASGETTLNVSSFGRLVALGNPGSPALITAETRQTVLTPNFVSAPRLVNGQLNLAFSTIPGRTYDVLASTDLVDWSPIGSATATDFDSLFSVANTSAYPHRFFRVRTP